MYYAETFDNIIALDSIALVFEHTEIYQILSLSLCHRK
jgi:hypothetical protein